MQHFARIVSLVNTWLGKAVGFLLAAMIASVAYEVAARYLFNRPTSWSFDVTAYLLCIYTMLGAGFTLLRNGHVNVDIVYGRFPFRVKAVLNCLTSLFFFIFVIAVIWIGGHMAYKSFVYGETESSILGWPLYPTKAMVPLGALLLLLQGVVKFGGDLMTAVTGREPAAQVGGGIFSQAKDEGPEKAK
jgi:TRAP-type mannitol/chloroaromatic compound transport system permease small subunit